MRRSGRTQYSYRSGTSRTLPNFGVGGRYIVDQPPRKNGSLVPVAVILLTIGLLGIGATYIGNHQRNSGKSAKPKAAAINAVTAPVEEPAPDPAGKAEAEAFQAKTASILAAYPTINISVCAFDYTNNYKAAAGKSERFTAASTAKLITVAAYMNMVENGKRSLDTMVRGVTAGEHIRRMLVNSDNDSWNTLNSNMTVRKVEAYAASNLGIANYDRPSNLLSAAEINGVLERLYNHQLMNQEHLDLVLGYMKIANYRSYIPAHIPAGYTVYHKAGMLNGNIHDSAIIVRNSDSKAIALTIFTSPKSTTSTATRNKVFGDVTDAAIASYFAQ